MKQTLLLVLLTVVCKISAQDYWTEYATSQPVANTGISSISIVDDNVTWLHMICGTVGCTPIRRYSRTLDSGLTWDTGVIDLGPDSTNLRIANIVGTSGTDAYVSVYPVTANVIGGIWKTTDGGANWARQNTATFNNVASFPSMVHFWNANEGVTIGDAVDGYFEIYTTDNGGNTWTRVPSSPSIIPLDPDEYLVSNCFTVTGNTIWAMTYRGRLLKSIDKGLHWTVSQTPVTGFFLDPGYEVIVDFAFTDQNRGLLQSSTYELYATEDGGTTWTDMSTVNPGYRTLAIAAIPGATDTYISIGEDFNGVRGSSYTVDAGLIWTNINDNPDLTYVDGGKIEMLNSMTGFAGGFSISPVIGGIFKWMAGGCGCSTTGFSNGKCMVVKPDAQSGIYNVIADNITQIVVSDAMGKQIFSTQYNNSSQVNVDTEEFSNGLYFIRVTNNDNASSVVKIIKQ